LPWEHSPWRQNNIYGTCFKSFKGFRIEESTIGPSISQIIAKHHRNVQHSVETSGCLTKDTFLCEQETRNIEGKKAKEAYKKHENDVDNVRMWGQENPNVLFYYQEKVHSQK
jgi:hypothetical protein